MSRNIYDMFNARKNGLDVLTEGTEYSDVEAYETVEEAIEQMNEIMIESSNGFIEFQAAVYLEDLVLENMMFDSFNAEEMEATMEATMKERAGDLGKRLNEQWTKIKNWFIATAKTIANFFASGEKLVSENKDKIPEALKKCQGKVKIYDYKDPKKALAHSISLITKLKGSVKGSKEAVIHAAGGKDKAEVVSNVKAVFGIVEGNQHEVEISSISAAMAMDYAGNKKDMLDTLKKMQESIDGDFKAALAMIENQNQPDMGEKIAVFDFAVSLKTAICNTTVACIKKGAGDYTKVIRKALVMPGKEKKEKEEKPEKDKKKFKLPFGKKKEGVKESLSFLDEELEFDDFE